DLPALRPREGGCHRLPDVAARTGHIPPMIRQSRVAPFIMLTESLGASDLSGSPMAINGMKVLTRATDDGGITLTKSGAFYRKFVTWAAEDIQWPEYGPDRLYIVNKVLNELDFMPLAIMHELLLGSR